MIENRVYNSGELHKHPQSVDKQLGHMEMTPGKNSHPVLRVEVARMNEYVKCGSSK